MSTFNSPILNTGCLTHKTLRWMLRALSLSLSPANQMFYNHFSLYPSRTTRIAWRTLRWIRHIRLGVQLVAFCSVYLIRRRVKCWFMLRVSHMRFAKVCHTNWYRIFDVIQTKHVLLLDVSSCVLCVTSRARSKCVCVRESKRRRDVYLPFSVMSQHLIFILRSAV